MSSRMDGPDGPEPLARDKESWRWENFNMSGMPPEIIAHGGFKRWSKYKTEEEFRRALRRNPNDLAVLGSKHGTLCQSHNLTLFGSLHRHPNRPALWRRRPRW